MPFARTRASSSRTSALPSSRTTTAATNSAFRAGTGGTPTRPAPLGPAAAGHPDQGVGLEDEGAQGRQLGAVEGQYLLGQAAVGVGKVVGHEPPEFDRGALVRAEPGASLEDFRQLVEVDRDHGSDLRATGGGLRPTPFGHRQHGRRNCGL